MARNWLRKCSLALGGGANIDLGTLRVVFKIEANSNQSPNMARFRVYNVSPTTASKLHAKEFTTVSFSAGYEEGNYGPIYMGDIKQAIIGHETPVDSYVDIFCADGGHGYIGAHVNKTLASGYRPQDKFDAAIAALSQFGISKGIVNFDLSKPQFPRGLPMFGMARDVLRTLALSKGANWSIQDGKVNMIDPKQPIGTTPVVINAQTGMIGWPKQTGDGIIVTSLINPALRPDVLVHLDNQSIIEAERDNNPITGAGSTQNLNIDNTGLLAPDGIYRVYYLTRSGDTRGTDWYDTSTCLAGADGAAGAAAPNAAQNAAGYFVQE